MKEKEDGVVVENVGIVDGADPQTEPSKVKTRYSDDELEEFKQIILKKIDAAHLIISETGDTSENDTTDTDPHFKRALDGGSHTNDDCVRTIARQKKLIEHLDAALVRIGNKTFGVNQETGKLISKERLRAVPHATQETVDKIKQANDVKKNIVPSRQVQRPSIH